MIAKLSVENSAIFGSFELHFKNGFCVFSGPSGSGKSVLMESLLSCFGLREPNAPNIETDVLLSPNLAKTLSDELGLEGELLNIKLVRKDKVRYFVNFTPIAKKHLSDMLGGYIKHIHSRGGDELGAAALLALLDTQISASDKTHAQHLATLKAEFEKHRLLSERLATLLREESQMESIKEMAEFEIAKIDSIQPKPGEYENLLDLKKTLSRKEKIKEAIESAFEAFEHTGKILSALAQITPDTPSKPESSATTSQKSSADSGDSSTSNGAGNADNANSAPNASQSHDKVTPLADTLSEVLNDAQALLEEESAKLESLEALDSEEMLHRISALSDLIRRYGSVEGALQHRDAQQKKLEELADFSHAKQELEKSISALESSLNTMSAAITRTRQSHLSALESSLTTLCASLKLQAPRVTLESKALEKNGKDALNISLGNSAIHTLSAGEFNRLRLAVMCMSARLEKMQGVLILDEIDANLSGEESEGVARVLKELSNSYQIFAISHQPHMPSLADYHFLVSKAGVESKVGAESSAGENPSQNLGQNISQSGVSKVTLLNKEGRIKELARMISGAQITQEALDFARKRLAHIE